MDHHFFNAPNSQLAFRSLRRQAVWRSAWRSIRIIYDPYSDPRDILQFI